MAKGMKLISLFSTFIFVIFVVVYRSTANDVAFTLAITFGTIAYHFIMRLLVGFVINLCLCNHVDYRAKWFRVSEAEQKIYKKLGVKKWKRRMPSYDPSSFDNTVHSWDEIAQAMCQAELVHELIIVFSFLPIFAAVPFGALPVFVITSVLAACLDAMFVIMQRYNRPRIIKLMEHADRKK
jgi:hypothetical protein